MVIFHSYLVWIWFSRIFTEISEYHGKYRRFRKAGWYGNRIGKLSPTPPHFHKSYYAILCPKPQYQDDDTHWLFTILQGGKTRLNQETQENHGLPTRNFEFRIELCVYIIVHFVLFIADPCILVGKVITMWYGKSILFQARWSWNCEKHMVLWFCLKMSSGIHPRNSPTLDQTPAMVF